jgi:hypothetical protein
MDAQQLKTVPLFSGLSKGQLQRLAELLDEVDLPTGKKLIGERTLAYEFVIIESGSASVSIDGHTVSSGAPVASSRVAAPIAPPRTMLEYMST